MPFSAGIKTLYAMPVLMDKLWSCGKYVKLVILATLVNPKSLSDLGIFWYGENGRFYKANVKEELERAVQSSLLVKDGARYKANYDVIIAAIYREIKDERQRELCISFWRHPFSRNTYLCPSVILQMFDNDAERAASADIATVVNMPLVLHLLQERDQDIYNLFVAMMRLEEYTRGINSKAGENVEKEFRNLKEKTCWLENLREILKNGSFFLHRTVSALQEHRLVR